MLALKIINGQMPSVVGHLFRRLLRSKHSNCLDLSEYPNVDFKDQIVSVSKPQKI